MKILVLGGCGIQGRAAVYDLARSKDVEQVLCADVDCRGLREFNDFTGMSKVRAITLDVSEPKKLAQSIKKTDVVVDLLPRRYMEAVCQTAIDQGVSVVNANYSFSLLKFHKDAVSAGVAILPECGLDPGIDFVLYGEAARQFDELNVVNSYCGGIPERSACDNPLNYKVSWVFEGVLSSTKRDSTMIKSGRPITISAAHQHDPENIKHLDFPGLGRLEAIPNGDAIYFTDTLGVGKTIQETGRYTLRWPGWSDFWRPLKQLGFLSEDPVEGIGCPVSPYELIDKLVGPQIQYQAGEKDLVVMVNIFEGRKRGKRVRKTGRLLIERDLETGLMAMAQGVGYPASVAAQMIASKIITAKGVLSPMRDIPYGAFINGLNARGIIIKEEEQELA